MPMLAPSLIGFVLALMAAADQETLPRAPQIVMDGKFDDWRDIHPAFIDPSGDQGESTADIRRVWVASDERYLYLRFELGRLLNLQHIEGLLRIFFDLDRSADTGYRVGDIGSDFAVLLPERHAVLQTPDSFEARVIPHADVGLLWEPTVASTEFEVRLERGAVLLGLSRPLFAGPEVAIVFGGEKPRRDTQEWAPDGPRGFVYRLDQRPPAPPPKPRLAKARPELIRLVSYNMLWGGLLKRPEPFDRILKAIQPDIVCFQEVGQSFRDGGSASVPTSQWPEAVRRRLGEILPLGDGRAWNLHKQGASLIASRWPLTMQMERVEFGEGSGQAMALVDLPDEHYARDLYVICTHYKCCGSLGSVEDQRRQSNSDGNVAWFRELREPGGKETLTAGTPFVLCGDLNLVGGPQVLDTLITGNILDENSFGPDSPPDWDGTALTDVMPLQWGDWAAYTWRDDSARYVPGRLDAVIYTDSVMRVDNSFILNTRNMSDAELGVHGLHREDSATASDHMPLVVDFDIFAGVGPATRTD